MGTSNPKLDSNTSRDESDDLTTAAKVLTAQALLDVLEEVTEGTTIIQRSEEPRTSWIRRLLTWLGIR